MNTFLYFESRVRARTSPKIIFRPPVDAKKIERYAPHLRLNREWGFIFRSIKRRGTVQKRIDTRARTG